MTPKASFVRKSPTPYPTYWAAASFPGKRFIPWTRKKLDLSGALREVRLGRLRERPECVAVSSEFARGDETSIDSLWLLVFDLSMGVGAKACLGL